MNERHPLNRLHRRTAFTLIELLAVLALSGLLMTALLQATASLGTTERAWDVAERQRGVTPPWLTRWREQLTYEVAAARRIQVSADGALVLDGYFGRRPDASGPSHEPARVTYARVPGSEAIGFDAAATQTTAAGVTLRREERWLLSTTNRPPQRSSVAFDLRMVTFSLSALPTHPETEPAPNPTPSRSGFRDLSNSRMRHDTDQTDPPADTTSADVDFRPGPGSRIGNLRIMVEGVGFAETIDLPVHGGQAVFLSEEQALE